MWQKNMNTITKVKISKQGLFYCIIQHHYFEQKCEELKFAVYGILVWALPPPGSLVASLISHNTAWAMGIIMAVVAVLLSHIDRNAVTDMNPNIRLKTWTPKHQAENINSNIRLKTLTQTSGRNINPTIRLLKIINPNIRLKTLTQTSGWKH